MFCKAIAVSAAAKGWACHTSRTEDHSITAAGLFSLLHTVFTSLFCLFFSAALLCLADKDIAIKEFAAPEIKKAAGLARKLPHRAIQHAGEEFASSQT